MSGISHSRLLRMAAGMLSDYADTLGNRSCNDWKWPPNMTNDEKEALILLGHEANGSPVGEAQNIRDDIDRMRRGDEYGPSDFVIAGALAHFLSEQA